MTAPPSETAEQQVEREIRETTQRLHALHQRKMELELAELLTQLQPATYWLWVQHVAGEPRSADVYFVHKAAAQRACEIRRKESYSGVRLDRETFTLEQISEMRKRIVQNP